VSAKAGMPTRATAQVHEAVDPAGSVQEAVVGMDVKMDEILVGVTDTVPQSKSRGGRRARRKPVSVAVDARKRARGCAGKKPLTRAERLRLVSLPFPFHQPSPEHVYRNQNPQNEPIDRAIRRMKKKLERENIIKGTRAKRYFEKPCEKRRRREKVTAFTAMLRRRHADEAVGSLAFCRRPINFGRRLFSTRTERVD